MSSDQATVKMKEYLAKLNRETLAAVEHGIGEGKNCRPLLVIAGAGTGKTKTLTHRVAHLIVNGCEPSRILLLTFTRRAASTMGRRANAITAAVLGHGRIELTWSGTFHSIGARLLRRYARRISLQPSFTILDRSDAADNVDWYRLIDLCGLTDTLIGDGDGIYHPALCSTTACCSASRAP
jgi:DNA helicase-2/ATP-dependent DNA helicase PcrA